MHFNNQLVLLPTDLRAENNPITKRNDDNTPIEYTADLQQHENSQDFQEILENFVASVLPPYGVPHIGTRTPPNLRFVDPTFWARNPLTSVPKTGGPDRVLQWVHRLNAPSEYVKKSLSILASSLSMPPVLSDVLRETQIPILRISVKSILGRMNLANKFTSDWNERAFGLSNAGPFLGVGLNSLDRRKRELRETLDAVLQIGLGARTIVYPNPRTRRHWLHPIKYRLRSLLEILEEQWPGTFPNPQNNQGVVEVEWPGPPPHVNAPKRYNRPIRSTWLLTLQLILMRIEFEVIPVLYIQHQPPQHQQPYTPMTAVQTHAIGELLEQVVRMLKFLRTEFQLSGRAPRRPGAYPHGILATTKSSILGMPPLYPPVPMA